MNNKKNIQELSATELDNICTEIKEKDWINRGLAWNATPLDKAKYEICQNILTYHQDNKVGEKEIAKKLKISETKTNHLLFCHIEKFTMDELVIFATKLLVLPFKLIIIPQETEKIHVRRQ
jgi:predicted XRE-type DNA-binding protein